jgi:hypothetical protein
VTARLYGVALAAIPMIAVATLALGLRIGATGDVRAAVVYAAPPAAMRSGLAWQIVVVREARGIPETIPDLAIVVTARAHGQEVTVRGKTSADGAFEAALPLAGVAPGEPVDVRVVEDGAPPETPALAEGVARSAARVDPQGEAVPGFLSPTKREGPVGLDVAILGGKLVVGFPSSVWIRTIDRATGTPLPRVVVAADPEPGLEAPQPRATSCESGWAEMPMVARGHVLGTSLVVHGEGGKESRWFGPLPVAPGSMQAAVPQEVEAGRALAIDVVSPTVAKLAYVEVDDAVGRVAARILELGLEPDGYRHAAFEIPPLDEGLYWLVTAGDPRGAETLGGAAIARPFRVRKGDLARAGACEDRARLALTQARGFPRAPALDGIGAARARDGKTHRRGIAIALVGLFAGAVLEILLVLRARANAERDATRLAGALDEAAIDAGERNKVLAGARGAVAIGLGLALLGFALLAALVTYPGR